MRTRKSKHGPNENAGKYARAFRAMLRFVEMSNRGRKTPGGTGGGARTPRLFRQRVAVRVSYSSNKNPGQWMAHGRYVARESATQGGRPAEAGFDAIEQSLNIPAALDSWQVAGDERFFKIIVSPEFADRLNLRQHTRELMQRLQSDVGTQLEWIAAVHHNTEHPHVHIAVRGVDEMGMPLRIPREYIRSGLRGRAEEIATDSLGYRSPDDAQDAQRRETLQNRYTPLDRILQRSNDRSSSHFTVVVNPIDASLSESGQQLLKHLAARLMHLQTIGLAQTVSPHEWCVQADIEKVLRTLQQNGDRQKMLAEPRTLISDKLLPLRLTTLRQFQTVSGRVLLHAEDEQTGKRYMLIEGTDAKVHLIYHTDSIEDARRQGKLAVHNFVRLEKRFAKKKPVLRVEDLGDATALLQ